MPPTPEKSTDDMEKIESPHKAGILLPIVDPIAIAI